MRFRRLLPLGVSSLVVLSAVSLHGGPVPPEKPGAYPAWWFQRDVIPRLSATDTTPHWPASYAPADDFAVANQGQLKGIVRKAYDELQVRLPVQAWNTAPGLALRDLVRGWYLDEALTQPKTTGTDAYASVNQGQLKHVASHFYELLRVVDYRGRPLENGERRAWSFRQTDDDAYAVANLGQLKLVFSFAPAIFDPAGDTDADGFPDGWEIEAFDGLSQGPQDDADGDGVTNLYERHFNTDPDNAEAYPSAHFRVDPATAPAQPDAQTTVFATVREALAAARASGQPFRIVEVAAGVYTGTANTALSGTHALQDVLLRAEPGATVILDGLGVASSGLELGARSGLTGLSLRALSFGVLVSGQDAWMSKCEVRETLALASAALQVSGATGFSMYDCMVEHNATRAFYLARRHVSGVGILPASAALRRLRVAHNRTEGAGGALLIEGGATVLLENCHLVANFAEGAGGALSAAGSLNEIEFLNCTVFANEGAPSGAALSLGVGTVLGATNTIFWNPTADTEFAGVAAAATSVDHSVVRGGWAGLGNLASDPLLTNSGFLTEVSPALDAGSLLGAPEHDAHGRPRPSGQGVDIGADEFQPGQMLPPEWWRLRYFGQTTVDPQADADGDGVNNLGEYEAGTNPRDSFDGQPPLVTVVAGAGQMGTSGSFLNEPIVIMATSSSGRPGAGLAVRVQASTPAASVNQTASETGAANSITVLTQADGKASVYIRP